LRRKRRKKTHPIQKETEDAFKSREKKIASQKKSLEARASKMEQLEGQFLSTLRAPKF
jgi:hypothetical protein